MTTIGDSFAIVAILFGIGFTAWAMILAASILFTEKAMTARRLTERHPWRSFVLGLLVGGPLVLVSTILANLPVPAIKLLGLVGFIALSALAMFGASGVCMSLAGRIRAMDPNVTLYGSVVRAASFIVISTFFPVIGWWFVAPLLFFVGLGVGMQALVVRAEAYEAA